MILVLIGMLLLVFGIYWISVTFKQRESSYQAYWGIGGILGGLASILWGIMKM
jgi:uncharacterized membrane protein HdeD (DUF308 family)